MSRPRPATRFLTLVVTLVLGGFPLAMAGQQDDPRSDARSTPVDVRVVAKGAKFVGTSMGGAEVVIRDVETRELLAKGVTKGSTGDTAKIMTDQARHHVAVSTEDAAVFHADLEVEEPRQIEVTVRAPLAQPQAINTVSVTQWVVPGRSITGGDGICLELPGFAVDVLSPAAHTKLRRSVKKIDLKANVVMMCGCPIVPDGLWDANQFEVAALVKHEGNLAERIPMEYAGETSLFATSLDVSRPGVYEVTVYAYDPADGNTGVDKTTFIVQP